jgi:hypothetical protein
MYIKGRKLLVGRVIGALVITVGLTTSGIVCVTKIFGGTQPAEAKEIKVVHTIKPEVKKELQAEVDKAEKQQPKKELSKIALGDDGYIDYMVTNFSVPEERAELIMESINETRTVLPTAMILGIMQKETGFKNIPAPSSKEDSMGYVQMKSETRHWLRNVYPELPYVADQQEFQKNPKVQIQYMVKYLELAAKKYNNDWEHIVSSYNMGMNNDKINRYYTGLVAHYETEIQKTYRVALND